VEQPLVRGRKEVGVSVTFVYRCHYQGPSEKHLRRFEDATVLDWFRNHWQGIADYDAAHEHAEQLLGCHVYMFSRLFVRIAEENWPPPEDAAGLEACLDRSLYNSLGVECSEHAVQVGTDDDELEMAMYFFDDHFLKKHGKLAAFLLHEDWKLPGGQREGRFRPAEECTDLLHEGKGATYAVFLTFYASDNLDGLEGGYRIKGVRLPELGRYLETLDPGEMDDWPSELRELRAQLFPAGKKAKTQEDGFLHAIRDEPTDESNWNVYADWLAERGLPPPGIRILEGALGRVSPGNPYGGDKPPFRKRQRDLIHAEERLVQVCLHLSDKALGRPTKGLFHQWILFDDLWASAHPELANAILRFARRWDVLTTD
jgi:uncharacterized protein (TIGR02996 family)